MAINLDGAASADTFALHTFPNRVPRAEIKSFRLNEGVLCLKQTQLYG